jgi:transcriptional regulator with XRE-family HTH domain
MTSKYVKKPKKKVKRKTVREKYLDELSKGVGGQRNGKYGDDVLLLARYMAKIGRTRSEIADEIGINKQTITNWARQHQEFADAIEPGSRETDGKVEVSLLNSATGYYKEEERPFLDKDGNPVIVKYQKWHAPTPSSTKFWLVNRKPDTWKDKQEIELKEPLEIIITDYRGKKK